MYADDGPKRSRNVYGFKIHVLEIFLRTAYRATFSAAVCLLFLGKKSQSFIEFEAKTQTHFF
jgi:hypothetical protein